ncbi:helix-turn-helix domain-containing protein [Enterococcus casseliflavus]|nr:helix-turn-helix domain-containing protein [Enterococcus casseliflavus]
MKEFQLKFISNKQIVRSLKILSLLQNHSVITMKELASVTNSSDRTILTDIHRIKDHFKDTISLEPTPIGYTFEIQNLRDYNEKKRALLEEEPLFQIVESIFFSECQHINEWSEQLFTTISTLNKLFKNITPLLKDYGISLSHNPVDFVGDEIDIRHFFHDFYYESDVTPHTIFPSLDIQETALTISRAAFFEEYSFISFTDFNYIIYITLTRILSGKSIEKVNKKALDLKNHLINHSNVCVLVHIKDLLLEYFNTEVNEIELFYLFIQLNTRRSAVSFKTEKLFIDRFNLWPEIKELAHNYTHAIDTPERYLKDGYIFFESFFISIKARYCLSPTLNQNLEDISMRVKMTFPLEFQKTYRFISSTLKEEYKLPDKQLEDITANLVLYTDSLRNFHWSSSKNIAILLEGNRFVVENIRSNAQRYLGKHCSLFFPDVTQLSTDYFQTYNIDFIVTNYNDYLINLDYGLPIILFDTTPSKKDWYKLFQKLIPNLTRLI